MGRKRMLREVAKGGLAQDRRKRKWRDADESKEHFRLGIERTLK